jgi:hypothetical protein
MRTDRSALCVPPIQYLHEHSHHHVDEYELGGEDEGDKIHGRDELESSVARVVTGSWRALTQGVLEDTQEKGKETNIDRKYIERNKERERERKKERKIERKKEREKERKKERKKEREKERGLRERRFTEVD